MRTCSLCGGLQARGREALLAPGLLCFCLPDAPVELDGADPLPTAAQALAEAARLRTEARLSLASAEAANGAEDFRAAARLTARALLLIELVARGQVQ